jgi:hypothetical protein
MKKCPFCQQQLDDYEITCSACGKIAVQIRDQTPPRSTVVHNDMSTVCPNQPWQNSQSQASVAFLSANQGQQLPSSQVNTDEGDAVCSKEVTTLAKSSLVAGYFLFYATLIMIFQVVLIKIGIFKNYKYGNSLLNSIIWLFNQVNEWYFFFQGYRFIFYEYSLFLASGAMGLLLISIGRKMIQSTSADTRSQLVSGIVTYAVFALYLALSKGSGLYFFLACISYGVWFFVRQPLGSQPWMNAAGYTLLIKLLILSLVIGGIYGIERKNLNDKINNFFNQDISGQGSISNTSDSWS